MAFGWLKKISTGALAGVHAVAGANDNPFVNAIIGALPFGGVIQKIMVAADSVEEAESGLKGADKQAAAFQAFLALEKTLGKDVLDDALVKDAISKGFSSYVAYQNAQVAMIAEFQAIQIVIADAKARHSKAS